MKTYLRTSVGLLVVAIGTIAAPAAGQDSQSAAKAATLRALLDQRRQEAIAVRDPDEPGRFVAALYLPGSQLLVVSGPYPVPAALDKRIAEGKYMDAYMDMQTTGRREGQFFVMDFQADGLRRVCEPEQPFDSTSRDGTTYMSFDGSWEAQKLTEAEYDARFREDDTRYTRMLTLLTAALTETTTLAGGVRKGGQ